VGYNTYVNGRYRIEPELPDHVISNLGMHEDGDSHLACSSGGTPDTVGLVNGQITVIPGDSWTEVESRHDEPYKAYDIQDHVKAMVEAAQQRGCTVNGALYLDGEDSRDFHRIRVENNAIHFETPELVWPNGDKGWS